MRAVSPLYFQAVTKYWEAYENLENRLAAKAKLLGGLDPNSGLRTTLSTKFKTTNTTLTITVKVAPHSGPDDLEVIVGNHSARAVSVKKTAEVHTLTFRASAEGAGQTLTLELR